MLEKQESQFLRYGNHTITYKDLFVRTQNFESLLAIKNVALLINGEKHPDTVCAIAASFHHGIPYLVIPNEMSLEKIPGIDEFTHFYSASTVDTDIPDHLKVISNQESTSQSTINTNRKPEENDIFAWVLSSGTTGNPKKIPLKRRQIHAAMDASRINFSPQPGDFWLLDLPLSHMGGQNVIIRALMNGSGIHLKKGSLSEELNKFPDINYFSLVPTQLHRLVNQNALDSTRVKGILIGGGPFTDDLIINARKMGLPVCGSYGMTETCGQIAVQQLTDSETPPASVGKILSGNKVRITDDSGKILPANSSGNIQLSGTQVPDALDFPDSFTDDMWFKTGDFGYLDENGYLFIEARRSDMIVSGGLNIRPAEIENLLNKLGWIKESVVLAQDNAEWGQIASAVIVLEDGEKRNNLELEMISREYLNELLPSWKIPKFWSFTKHELPKNEMGKVLRNKILI